MKCLPGRSKTVSIAEEVERFYYDASEGFSEFEVMMEVESDFEDTDNQDSGFFDMSEMKQVLEKFQLLKKK
jgi:hypothetical protein